MKKKHTVFIDLTAQETAELLHSVLKRKGWLKGVPKDAEMIPFENADFSIEYTWEEN